MTLPFFKDTLDHLGLSLEDASYYSGIPFSDMLAHFEGDTELVVDQISDLAACVGLEVRQLFVLSGDLEPTKTLIKTLRALKTQGELDEGKAVRLGTAVRYRSRVKSLQELLEVVPCPTHTLEYLTMEAYAQGKIGQVEVCRLLTLKLTDRLPSHPEVIIHSNLLKPLLTREQVAHKRVYLYMTTHFEWPHMSDCVLIPHEEGFRTEVTTPEGDVVHLFVDEDFKVTKET